MNYLEMGHVAGCRVETLEQSEAGRAAACRPFPSLLLGGSPSQSVVPHVSSKSSLFTIKPNSKEFQSASREHHAWGLGRASFFLTVARRVSGIQTLVLLAILPSAELSLPGDVTQRGAQFCPLPGAGGRVPWAFLLAMRHMDWGLAQANGGPSCLLMELAGRLVRRLIIHTISHKTLA